MASKINYNNKAPFQTLEEIPDENKVNANDMNEIKTAVNNNADELDTAKEDIESLQNGQGTASTDITSLKNRTTALETDNTTNKQNIQNLQTENETNKSDIEELQTDNETNKTNITDLQNDKVDKVEGKGLSTEDFTTELKEKVEGLENYDDTEIKEDISNLEAEQTEQNEQIDILLNALPSETQEGENINIKGTIPTRFKKFVVKGNSKQETRSGKNKFNNQSLEKGSIGASVGNKVTYSNSDTRVRSIENTSEKLKTSTEYKIICPENIEIGITIVNSALIVYSSTWLNNEQTFSTSSDSYDVIYTVRYSDNSNITVDEVKEMEIQIEEGPQATEYEPYGVSPSPDYPSEIQNVEGDVNVTVANKEKTEQQVVTFPLSEGQKLMQGDYLADDGIHHKRKQIELDGTDFSLYSNQVSGRTIYTISAFSNNNNFKTYDSSILCNILKQGASSNGNNYLNNNGSSGNLYVSIENSILGITDESTNEEKLQAFQNLIAETGFVYEGELAEEEIEPYTEEQEEAYNQICNLKAYEEETNIYSTNEVSPVFKVTAVKDINSVIEDTNAKIEAINELLSTTATSAMLLDNMQSDLESEVM